MQEKDRSADRVSFEQMLTQERLITIGRLTPGIMHEINNPLQVIRGALQLAQDDIDKPVVLQEYITISPFVRSGALNLPFAIGWTGSFPLAGADAECNRINRGGRAAAEGECKKPPAV